MSSKMIADQESTIKDSLFEFVQYHIPDADLTLIDDIVLSYVIAFLEDVGSDSQFDVEGRFVKKCCLNQYSIVNRIIFVVLNKCTTSTTGLIDFDRIQ